MSDYWHEYAEGDELIDADYPDEWTDDTDELSHVMDHAAASWQETAVMCALPTLRDVSFLVGKLIFWCLLLRLVLSLVRVDWMCHVSSALIGSMVLANFFGKLLVYFLAHATLAAALVTIMARASRQLAVPTVAVVSLLFLLVCELLLVDSVQWHSVRGAQMVLMMKAVSAMSDLPVSPAQHNITRRCLMIPLLLGYLLHPGSCVFGPWLSVADYRGSIDVRSSASKGRVTSNWLLSCLVSIVTGLAMMSVSMCWLPLILPDYLAMYSVWIVAYREALSFRMSHYFVSHISQASLQASGVSSAIWTDDGGELRVCRAGRVETARSLVDVVVHWNLPVHFWLKKYVYGVTRAAGSCVAVLSTFAASAMLHGLNVQLAVVLLSLGLASLSEHRLRRVMARAFSSCVLARPCGPRRCCHLYCGRSWPTRLVNACLCVVCALQLTYLGVGFDGSAGSERGYNWQHLVARWQQLGYLGHWLTALSLFTAKIAA